MLTRRGTQGRPVGQRWLSGWDFTAGPHPQTSICSFVYPRCDPAPSTPVTGFMGPFPIYPNSKASYSASALAGISYSWRFSFSASQPGPPSVPETCQTCPSYDLSVACSCLQQPCGRPARGWFLFPVKETISKQAHWEVPTRLGFLRGSWFSLQCLTHLFWPVYSLPYVSLSTACSVCAVGTEGNLHVYLFETLFETPRTVPGR